MKQNGDALHEKILQLISSLEAEMSELKVNQATELDAITRKCRQDIQKLQEIFSGEIDHIQHKHQEKLSLLV